MQYTRHTQRASSLPQSSSSSSSSSRSSSSQWWRRARSTYPPLQLWPLVPKAKPASQRTKPASRRTKPASRRTAAHATDSNSHHETDPAQQLLEWIHSNYGEDDSLGLEVKSSEDGSYRGVYATRAFERGRVILRVPTKLGLFASESATLENVADAAKNDYDIDDNRDRTERASPYPNPKTDSEDRTRPESFWTGRLAVNMLQTMFAGRAADSPHWELWKKSLPERVKLPVNGFDDDALYKTECKEFISEVSYLHLVNQRVKDALRFPEVLAQARTKEEWTPRKYKFVVDGEGSLGAGGLDWALGIVSSRAFRDDVVGHYICPGIDLFNHDYAPKANAILDAEIAMAVHNPEMGTVRVIADDDIQPGQEIKFTYAKVPNEVLLNYYGFVPEQNPHDDVVVFPSLRDCINYVSGGLDRDQMEEAVSRVLHALRTWEPQGRTPSSDVYEGDLNRLTLNINGLDGRLVTALSVVTQLFETQQSIGEIILNRVRERLDHYSTSLGEDEFEISELEAGTPEHTAMLLRISKKRILESARAALSDIVQEQSKKTDVELD